jgi:hypothetical protein
VASPSDHDKLVQRNTPPPWMNAHTARLNFVEQVRGRFQHWQHQRRNEMNEMDAVIERIRNTDNLDDAYEYPQWDWQVSLKFVDLKYSKSVAKFFSATVYNVEGCNEDIIHDIIQKKTTRSVINVPLHLVNSIPENNHLLYLSSEGGQEPPFIKRNRDQWWDEQTSNSSMFYFSPKWVSSRNVCSTSDTIAHISIFLQTRTRLRLHLLHYQYDQVSVSIQEKKEDLHFISTDEITKELELHLQDFDLNSFEPGRHELELVVHQIQDGGVYCLRDILVEFFEDSLTDSSDDSELHDDYH